MKHFKAARPITAPIKIYIVEPDPAPTKANKPAIQAVPQHSQEFLSQKFTNDAHGVLLKTLYTVRDTESRPTRKRILDSMIKQAEREDRHNFNVFRYAVMLPFGNPSLTECGEYLRLRNKKTREMVGKLWATPKITERLYSEMGKVAKENLEWLWESVVGRWCS